MALSVNDSIQNNSPKPVDNKYGLFTGGAFAPYASVSQANSTIAPAYRSIGLTVLIATVSGNIEYWYQAGIADGNLVPKSATATVNAPLTLTSGVIGIQQSNTSQDGYLASADWNTFNGKISGAASTGTGIPIYANTTSGTINIKSIAAGTGMTLTDTGTTITLNAGASGVVNIGSGAGIYAGLSGNNSQLRSIIVGAGMNAAQNSADITITLTNTYVGTITTSNATATTALSIPIEDSSAGLTEITVIGVITGSAANCVSSKKFVQYYKQGGTLTIISGPGDIIADTYNGTITTASWTITADGTTNNLDVVVTGQASTNISWTIKATKAFGQ